MPEQLLNILACITIWTVSWGFFFFFMYRRGVGYVRHFLFTAFYFFSVAVITTIFFWNYIYEALRSFTAMPLIILGLFILSHLALYTYLPKYLREPKEYLEKYPYRQYLNIDKRMLVSKSMDILAQQIFIILLITFLKDADLTLAQIIIAFAVIFGLLHAPLVISERGRWPSWHFAITALLFSIIFPILILEVRSGFIYTYIIHWTFYIFTAVGFWIWYAKSQKIIPSI